MTKVVLALVAGFVSGTVFLHLLRPTLASPVLERSNYRGHRLATAGGVVGVVATVVAGGAWWFVNVTTAVGVAVVTVLGFGLLGFVDDVLAAGSDRGFAGHLRALAHGRLTTGGLKLLGGGVIGVIAAIHVDGDHHWRVVVDALLLALAANAGNLFDRAPGRTLKVGTAAAVVLAILAGRRSALTGPAIAVGAFLALLPADLGEELMLGDTGANAFGGALGLGVLLTTSFGVRIGVAIGLLAVNALSELVSFSVVIDRVAALRWVDRLGRSPGYPEVP